MDSANCSFFQAKRVTLRDYLLSESDMLGATAKMTGIIEV